MTDAPIASDEQVTIDTPLDESEASEADEPEREGMLSIEEESAIAEQAEIDGAESDDAATWIPDDDPLPTEDEIAQVDVADVELREPVGEPVAMDAESIESLADDEPLDVGDLLSDDEDEVAESVAQITPLRGDSSFAPDDDSLQLEPDPTTGELTMQPDESGDDEFILDELDDEDDSGQPG